MERDDDQSDHVVLLNASTPEEVRTRCRRGEFTSPTCGFAGGHAQANLVVLPKEYAFDFLLFCQRNPKSCPLLEVLEPGHFSCSALARDCDIRTDLPRYRIFEHGVMTAEVSDITSQWRDDLVSFIIGCSFSFEEALVANKVPVRHIEQATNVPMFETNIACRSAGCFSGNLVVSMRPLTAADAIKATTITSKYPRVHGAPVHLGNPAEIGIADVSRPDYGDAVPVRDGEITVFWACGVTPQVVMAASRPSFCITHAPGCMLVLDTLNEELAGSA